jgi:hypothetical protein
VGQDARAGSGLLIVDISDSSEPDCHAATARPLWS